MDTPSATIPAPRARLSADGRTAAAGPRTLTVSATKGLDATGTSVTVTGRGYDTFKGVYVAFCMRPKLNHMPTPCGGGATTTGSTGASQWVSSNPPPYGRGLAVPYGPDGSFTATLNVSAALAPKVDCRRVQCVIVTRNDHTRTTDRSQDVFVPVTFTGSRLVTVPSGAASGSSSGGSGVAIPLVIGSAVVVVGAILGGVALMRRRSRRQRDGVTTTTAPSL